LNPHEIAPASTSSENLLFRGLSPRRNSLILHERGIAGFPSVSLNRYKTTIVFGVDPSVETTS
jgi:hypothetical protein